MEFHPIADIFPLVPDEELRSLAEDISQNGLLEPIWLYEGKILDGRNRYKACEMLGLAAEAREWSGEAGSPTDFVLSKNLSRRHMNSSQRAACAVAALPFLEEEAKDRQRQQALINQPQSLKVELFPPLEKRKARDHAAVAFGTNPRYIQDAKKLEDESPELFERVKTGEITIPQAKREAKGQEVLESIAELNAVEGEDRVYNVIYADPPWQYDNAIRNWGPAKLHYRTMPLDKICSLAGEIRLPIADNAVLFLWVTNPFLRDAFSVVDAWGFEYKTHMVWVKTDLVKPGSGFYIRGRHELLFICTRGSFTPPDKHISPPIGSVIEAPLQEHSRKPPTVYDIIERLYPGCNYIELFARSERDGWNTWGDEVGKY